MTIHLLGAFKSLMNWTNFHKQFQTANAITGD